MSGQSRGGNRHLFLQNVIALVWDFDKTLIPGYMQDPLFQHYGVDAQTFWAEVNALPAEYRKRGVELISTEVLYLNHILEEDTVLDNESLATIRMPARDRFIPDDRQNYSEVH